MITSQLSEYICNTDYNQLPPSVVEKAKLCFIDFLGVSLRGSNTESGLAIRDILNYGHESTVIGHGKASALEASLANGIFAHALDLDDGHRWAQLHPGACVMPAALSLCEKYGKNGCEFINSVVVGYEVTIMLGLMVNPGHRRRGFHSTGTCGTFGAAAAASNILNLDQEQTMDALGLAGTQAAGLLESDHSGSMGKHLHTGRAAQSGVLSTLLTKKGFNGPHTIFEGDEGFLKAMTDIDIHKTLSPMALDKFKILEVYFKIYPVCRHLHSSIEALLHIINNKDLKKGEIEKITVETYGIAAEHDDYHPQTSAAIRQSLPVSLAIAFLKRNLKVEDLYITDEISDEIEELSSKIVIQEKKELDELYPHQRPSHVIINTANKLYEKKIDLAWGEPEKPLRKADIVKKFTDLNPQVNGEVLE
ncbi:MAG: MmgE/PrpD family protein, partial [Methanobacteriaceae archaeon]|nr:MmgE/PrpD family protein [Methanobacteriaceae archaeon]